MRNAHLRMARKARIAAINFCVLTRTVGIGRRENARVGERFAAIIRNSTSVRVVNHPGKKEDTNEERTQMILLIFGMILLVFRIILLVFRILLLVFRILLLVFRLEF